MTQRHMHPQSLPQQGWYLYLYLTKLNIWRSLRSLLVTQQDRKYPFKILHLVKTSSKQLSWFCFSSPEPSLQLGLFWRFSVHLGLSEDLICCYFLLFLEGPGAYVAYSCGGRSRVSESGQFFGLPEDIWSFFSFLFKELPDRMNVPISEESITQ